jgi:predicted RNA-binding protein YlxR (DUF448 family)
MKSKTLVLACALTAASFSFNAFSQDSAVCADPLKKICLDTTTQRAQRDVYVKNLQDEIAKEAAKNAAPRIEEMKKKVSVLHPFKRLVQKYKINNQEIMNSAKKRIAGLETVVTNPENVALLKSYMKQAIDESKFDDSTKNSFKATMDSVLIGNFGDYLERTGLEDDALGQLLGNACGSDGMVANAFATTIKDQRYVLICPGFLITLSQSATPAERFNTILHAISHEMGHHIDNSQVGNELYKPYLSCLSENYSDKFNKTADDAKYCQKIAKSAAECNDKVTITHAGELIADQWGIKVTAIHARANAYTTAQADAMLTNSWSALCPGQKELRGEVTSDEGIHPTGIFRIGTLMRTNPDISDYLNCNNSAITKPACTLDGAVNL